MTRGDEGLLTDLLAEIEEAKRLFARRILRESEFKLLDRKIHTILPQLLIPDSDLQREYEAEKRRTVWRTLESRGMATDLGRTNFWEDFIRRILEESGSKPAAQQQVIHAGQHFTARSALRDIFNQATSSVAIFDEYLDNSEILNIVEPIVAKNIQVKLLKNSPSRAFISDSRAFAKQYGYIELRSHVTNCHDRFIILDGTIVYQVGHSLKDLGSKLATITKLEETQSKEVADIFHDWWKQARVII